MSTFYFIVLFKSPPKIIIINRNTPNSSTVFKPNKRNNSGCLYVSKTDGSLWLYKNRRYINYDPYLFEEQIKQNKKIYI